MHLVVYLTLRNPVHVNHPTLPDPLAFPNDDMTFTVQVTDSNGCIDFDDVNITVFIANAGTDTIICNGDSIQKNHRR